MAGGVIAGLQAVPRDAKCITCGYSLDGLRRDGVCPECATPVGKSLDPGVLGFLSQDDARRLDRATAKLNWVLYIGVANIVVSIVVLIAQGAGAIVVMVFGPVSWLAGLGLWLLAWLGIARVREHGAGRGAGLAHLLLPFVAWGQCVAVVGALVCSAAADGEAAIVVSGILTCVGLFAMTLVAGQWRLSTLVGREGVSALAKAGRDSARLILFVVCLGMVGGCLAFAVKIEWGLPICGLAMITGLFAAIGWFLFIRDLRKAARTRSGEAAWR